MGRAARSKAAGGQDERDDGPEVEGLPMAGYRDNVPRRKAFEAAHPNVKITCDDDGWKWTADGTLNGQPVYLTSTVEGLGGLLDRLDARAAKGAS